MYNTGVKKIEKLEFIEKQLNQNEMIELVKSENFKKLDKNSLNDIVNFGFSSILDNEYELENIKYKELEEIF